MALGHAVLVSGQLGQTVEFYPPEDELIAAGAPVAGATYAAYLGTDSDEATPQFSGSATLDSTVTTVDQASGYGQANPSRLFLASTTNFVVGARYLVTSSLGHRHLVRPRTVGADYIDLDEDLQETFGSGDSVVGVRHVFTVDPTFIADTSKINVYGAPTPLSSSGQENAPPYRIRWTYTLGSAEQQIAWTSFDVSRKRFKTGVSLDDIRPQVPGYIWREWAEKRGDQFDEQIEEALRLLRFDIRMAGYDPDRIEDPEIAARLHVQRAICVIATGFEAEAGTVSDWLRMQLDTYQKMFQQALGTGLRTWIDTGSSGAVNPAPARQLWLKPR
jgi:hypothetical protein